MFHEKLHCYQGLIGLAPKLQKIVMQLPTGYSYLGDQLKRALASSILNLAEGNAKYSPKERRRFFLASRGSIAEIAAILDVLEVFNLISGQSNLDYKAELGKYYAMISNL